jgi:hypothetical protein
LYKSTPESEPCALVDPLPKAILVHFSGKFKEAFPATSPLLINQSNQKTAYTLTVGTKEANLTALKWMVQCCSGRGIVQVERNTFFQYARVLEVAEALDIPILCKQLNFHMKKIAETQVPIEDVQLVYHHLPTSSPIRQLVVESIGNAIWNRTLQYAWAYRKFRDENLEYAAEVSEHLAKLRAPQIEAEKAARKEQRKEERKEKRAKHREWNARQEQRQNQCYMTMADLEQKMGATTVTKTKKIQGVEARKATNGQSYYHFNLKDLGVGRNVVVPTTQPKQWVSAYAPQPVPYTRDCPRQKDICPL